MLQYTVKASQVTFLRAHGPSLLEHQEATSLQSFSLQQNVGSSTVVQERPDLAL